jgi:hypothetical protein
VDGQDHEELPPLPTAPNEVNVKRNGNWFCLLMVVGAMTLQSCDFILESAVMAAGGYPPGYYPPGTPHVEAPVFSLPSGTYTSAPQIVVIGTTTPMALIRYTTDGSVPTSTSGFLYTEPLPIASTVRIRAAAFAAGYQDSPVANAFYHFWLTFGSQGTGMNEFWNTYGVAVDKNDSIYIADSNGRIVHIDDISGGGWISFGTDGGGTNQFHSPRAIAVDEDGHIYVADNSNNRIVRIDDMSGIGWTTFGTYGTGVNQFRDPSGIALDASGRLYIADCNNDRVVRIDDMTGAGWIAFGATDLYAVALDSQGRIYIGTEVGIERVDDMNGTGRISFGTHGSGTNQFYRASAISVDDYGRIYIADGGGNGRIVRIDDMYGSGWTTLGTYGTGTNQFGLNCLGMTLDNSGNTLVADSDNSRIVQTSFLPP